MNVLQIFVVIGFLITSTTQVWADPTICVTEIRLAEELIRKQGADAVSAQAAQRATAICRTEMTPKESEMAASMAEQCNTSFADSQGTATQAMLAICEMNAIRYVLSLQLDLNK